MAETCKHLMRGAPDCVFCHRDQLKQENERLKQRCWALAFLLYPAGEPREAVAGDFGLCPAPIDGKTTVTECIAAGQCGCDESDLHPSGNGA